MERKFFHLLVALLTFFFGVVFAAVLIRQPQTNSSYLSSQTLPASQKAQPTFTTEIRQAVKLPDFSQSRIASIKQSKNSNTRMETLRIFNVKANFSGCQGYDNISKWNGADPGNLYVNQAWRLTVDNQPWLYHVAANPPNILITFSFDYIDDDGDGIFDRCASSGFNKTFEMPEWARKRANKKQLTR